MQRAAHPGGPFALARATHTRGTLFPSARSIRNTDGRTRRDMRGILLWAIGVPIPVIILIYLLF
jgi:hypothetical protein